MMEDQHHSNNARAKGVSTTAPPPKLDMFNNKARESTFESAGGEIPRKAVHVQSVLPSPSQEVHWDPVHYVWDARSVRDTLPKRQNASEVRYTTQPRGEDDVDRATTYSATRQAARAKSVVGYEDDSETDFADIEGHSGMFTSYQLKHPICSCPLCLSNIHCN